VYKLHLYETASGLKLVLMTDAQAPSMRETLQRIHSQFYVEYVAKNPLVRLEDPIDNEAFVKNLDRYVRSLANFQ
jgi:trafficking protein particle complex subunit 1